MITKPTIRWGVWGAIICLLAYSTAFALRVIFPDSEQVHSVLFVMAAPVLLLWEAIGVRGEATMAMGIPIIISSFLFPVVVGFGLGALTYRIFVPR